MNSAQLLRARPELFGKLVLGADLWSTQRAILQAVTRHRRVAVKACHASGKSFAIAVAVLWWIVAHRDGIAVTTAPTWVQVQKIIWGEIRRVMSLARARGQLVLPVPNQTELTIAPGNYALGLSTDDSTRFQGFHAGKVLVVLDEAPGVRGEIFEAVEGIAAGGDVHVLALGNPVTAGGPFYDAFTSDRGRWKTFTIDAFDTPNLEGLSLEQLRSLPPDLPESHPLFSHAPRPYLTTRRYVYESFLKYGEASPFWQARVRGQFPEQAEDALISLRWLEAAHEPKRLPNDDLRLYAGIDVAEAGNDETVCVIRTARGRIVAMESWRGNSRGPVIAFLNQFKDRLEEINFDRAGVGAYFADDFELLGFRNVNGINVGKATRFSSRFRNLKAELYWALRERFQEGQISGLTDELATAQLASIRYEINPRGLVEIESKDEMRKRGVKSPDRAEALMLAFADCSPSMLTYVRQRAEYQQAVETAAREGKPPPDERDQGWDPTELSDAYHEIQLQMLGGGNCPKCGEPLGATKTMNSDGNYYHPQCVRGW
jgi:phage terminase large subunit